MSLLHTDLCPPRFSAVRAVFVEHLDSGQELGAGFALALDGEIVIDLTGVRKFTPYVKNGTAQLMNNDAGTNMVVKITPFSVGVTA